MKWYSLKFSAFALVVFLVNCGGSSVEVDKPVVPTDRVISFSGMDWIVRTTNNKTEGPGLTGFQTQIKMSG